MKKKIDDASSLVEDVDDFLLSDDAELRQEILQEVIAEENPAFAATMGVMVQPRKKRPRRRKRR